MIQKLKKCSKCNQLKVIWKNCGGDKFCKNCWSCHSGNKGIKPSAKKIPPRSSKKLVLDKEYSKLRKEFLTKHAMCEAHLTRCSIYATDVHHASGRGKHYLDMTTWKALCRTCHSYIELHPIFAKQIGMSTNRN